jgi:hypothetical protein
MAQFPYENLNDGDFENLVIRICKEILGIGCKTFSVGRDGAKDSWFTGTAERFPSKVAPWSGTFNIQAKHTKTYNLSCSDNDFSVNQSSIITKEIKRLNEIKILTPFNNYILFTNRKLTGESHVPIIKILQDGLGINNTEIIGREQLDTYLTDYPDIAFQFGLHLFSSPLRFYEKDIRDVIIVFYEQSKDISAEVVDYLKTFNEIDKERKNKLNELGKDYFDFIINHSNQYFKEIEAFLINPINDKFTKMYSNTVSDLQAKILLDRNRFNEFQHLLEHLVDFIVNNNEEKLKDLRKIVRVFVHFMYFNCDIGKTQ